MCSGFLLQQTAETRLQIGRFVFVDDSTSGTTIKSCGGGLVFFFGGFRIFGTSHLFDRRIQMGTLMNVSLVSPFVLSNPNNCRFMTWHEFLNGLEDNVIRFVRKLNIRWS
jgi:hypothetical protein